MNVCITVSLSSDKHLWQHLSSCTIVSCLWCASLSYTCATVVCLFVLYMCDCCVPLCLIHGSLWCTSLSYTCAIAFDGSPSLHSHPEPVPVLPCYPLPPTPILSQCCHATPALPLPSWTSASAAMLPLCSFCSWRVSACGRGVTTSCGSCCSSSLAAFRKTR